MLKVSPLSLSISGPTASVTSTPTGTPTTFFTSTITPSPTLTRTASVTPTPTISPTFALVSTQPVLWPNPCGAGSCNLQLNLSQSSPVKIEVYTVSFRMIFEEVVPQVSAGTTDLTLQLVDKAGISLANGLYYVVVTTADGRAVDKLMVIR